MVQVRAGQMEQSLRSGDSKISPKGSNIDTRGALKIQEQDQNWSDSSHLSKPSASGKGGEQEHGLDVEVFAHGNCLEMSL
jgi:hypothetical protein